MTSLKRNFREYATANDCDDWLCPICGYIEVNGGFAYLLIHMSSWHRPQTSYASVCHCGFESTDREARWEGLERHLALMDDPIAHLLEPAFIQALST